MAAFGWFEWRTWVGQRSSHLVTNLYEKLTCLEMFRRKQIRHCVDWSKTNTTLLAGTVEVIHRPVGCPFLQEWKERIVVLAAGNAILENIKCRPLRIVHQFDHALPLIFFDVDDEHLAIFAIEDAPGIDRATP